MQMLYMPVCFEGRFAREGAAQAIEMPLRTRPLSPITYTTIPIWALLISCPPDCRGYENRTVAKVLAIFKKRPHIGASQKSTSRWDWKFWFGVIGVPIAVMIVGAVLGWLTPEGRRWLGIDKPKPAVAPSVQNPQPQTLSPVSPATSSETKTQQGKPTAAKSATKGGAANKASQPKPITQINAPQGIAIGGHATVNNPTVNNFGPPAVQLTWSVSDTQPNENFTFAKAVTVKSNTYYSPVYIAVFCDAEVEQVLPLGVYIGLQNGYINNDKKAWFIRLNSPPVTPTSPMTFVIQSKKLFEVLSVRKVEDQQP
jgi:hypothetical protein